MTLLIAERNRLMAQQWVLQGDARIAARRRVAEIDRLYGLEHTR